MLMKILKEDIEKLVNEGKSVRQIQKELGCAYKTVQRRLVEYGLKTKRSIRLRNCKYCDAKLTGHKQYFCNDNCKAKYYYREKTNNSVIAKSQKHITVGRERKKTLVNHLGGKCAICGYDKNLASLNFHHINIDDKKFQISGRLMSTKPFDELLVEANKCMLVCNNCHMELHYPHLNNWNK